MGGDEGEEGGLLICDAEDADLCADGERYGRLGWIRRPGTGDRAIAMDCLGKVGMADFAGRQISQLSGGQKLNRDRNLPVAVSR